MIQPTMQVRFVLRATVFGVLGLLASVCSGGILENPSFEVGSGSSATGWRTDVRNGRYEFLVAGDAHSGNRCLAIKGLEAGWARWYTVDVFLLEDSRYRISCWVKTEGEGTGRVWLPDGGVSLGFKETPEWKQVQTEFTTKRTGRYGLYLENNGGGTVFFDDIAIECVATKPMRGTGIVLTNGAPITEIVVPDDSDPAEGYLGLEVRRVLKEMTGVEIAVSARSSSRAAGGRPILIGRAADLARYRTDLARAGDEGIVLDLSPKAVSCFGNTPRGTYYAVQEFFHLIGCRWYMPWPGGECIPRAAKLTLPTGKIVHRPSFALRGSKTVQVYHSPPAWLPATLTSSNGWTGPLATG